MYIYTLSHPSSDRIYVGKTNNLSRRFQEHYHIKKNTPVSFWNQKLKQNGLKPDMIIIEITSNDPRIWEPREIYWIAYYRGIHGRDLVLNIADGGGNSPGTKGMKFSEEIRENMRQAQLGRKHPDEVKKKIKQSHLGKEFSLEHKNNISKSKKGNQIWLGKKHKPESVLRMAMKHRRFTNKEAKIIYDKHWIDKVSQNQLAKEYKCSRNAISNIVHKKFKITSD